MSMNAIQVVFCCCPMNFIHRQRQYVAQKIVKTSRSSLGISASGKLQKNTMSTYVKPLNFILLHHLRAISYRLGQPHEFQICQMFLPPSKISKIWGMLADFQESDVHPIFGVSKLGFSLWDLMKPLAFIYKHVFPIVQQLPRGNFSSWVFIQGFHLILHLYFQWRPFDIYLQGLTSISMAVSKINESCEVKPRIFRSGRATVIY